MKQRTGRPVALWDIAVATALSGLGIWQMVANKVVDDVDVSWLLVPFFLAITVPTAWRRTAPLAAMAAVFGGLLLHFALFGHDVIRCGALVPLTLIMAFTLGSVLPRREALYGLAGAALFSVTLCLTDGADGILGAIPFLLFLSAVGWGLGRLVYSRKSIAETLAARTGELREARDERARLEVATERARVSGELDELLQRRLGDLARLAEAGTPNGDARAATATLIEIETEGRRTLDQMRDLVGVLRDDEPNGAPLAPQPTLTHLDALLVRAKGSGAHLTVEGSPRVLPAGVELAAYRIVEHLLGALDDTPDVDVKVTFGDDVLQIAVAGHARRGERAAIARARERAELHRGTLESRVRGGRAEAVASLPMLAGA